MTSLLWLLLVGGIAGCFWWSGYAAARRTWKRRADYWFTRAVTAEGERWRHLLMRYDLHPWHHGTRCYADADALIASVGGRVVEERE